MNTVICFDSVSKRFIIHHEKARSLQDLWVNIFRNGGTQEELWVLKELSLELQRGETLGIVGRNGSGKSTVLKLASRIIEPTSGRVEVQGRVVPLLELGAGFHPDLTGRDNVYVNAALLGLSRKETTRRFDCIVSFAELERFIDQPMKHYSSGMYLRLGLAVAMNLDADAFLVDEVLAVGDISFQQKCLQRFVDLRDEGKAIIFVSHDLDCVTRICDRAIWLDQGVVKAEGDPRLVVAAYQDDVFHLAGVQTSGDTALPEP